MYRGVAVEDVVREGRWREGLDIDILDGRIVEDTLAHRPDFLPEDDRRKRFATAKGLEANRGNDVGHVYHPEAREAEGPVVYLGQGQRQTYRHEFLEAVESVGSHDIERRCVALIVSYVGSHHFGICQVERLEVAFADELTHVPYVLAVDVAADDGLDGLDREGILQDAWPGHDNIIRARASHRRAP